MPKEKARGKGRGRKRKSSSPVESDEPANRNSEQPVARGNDVNATNGGGKYVPRFGSAAKRQRVESEGKKVHGDGSDGEELVLCPISCTQPVGGARGDDTEREWSSTQPASKFSEVDAAIRLLHASKSQQNIPDASETKEKEICFVPGLALSQGLPLSPSPVRHCSKLDSLSSSPVRHCSNPDSLSLSPVRDCSNLDSISLSPVRDCSNLDSLSLSPVRDCSNLDSLSLSPVRDCSKLDSLSPIPARHCMKDVSFSPCLGHCNDVTPSTDPTKNCSSDNETEISNNHNEVDNNSHRSEGIAVTAVGERDCNEREVVDSKCLNLLNPLGEDLGDNVTSLVKDVCCSEPGGTTELSLTVESHRNDTVGWPQNGVEDAIPLSSCPDQLSPEPIVESLYSSPSQHYKRKHSTQESTTCSESHLEEARLNNTAKLAPPTACDELEVMKEMNELRAADLEESQAFAVTVDDQVAPAPSPMAKSNNRFVGLERRPSLCSRDSALDEGTRIVQGLVNELSALKFILHCKKELGTVVRQHRGTRQLPHQLHPSGLQAGRNHYSRSHW